MTTLELSRQSTSVSSSSQTPRLEPWTSCGPRSFPSVPAHDPRDGTIEPERSTESDGPARKQQDVRSEHRRSLNEATGHERQPNEGTGKVTAEDEEEEVLEELQDEIGIAHGASLYEEGVVQHSSTEIDTLPLLQATQATCLAVLQSLLQDIHADSTQTTIVGGPHAVESLIEASQSASNSATVSPVLQSASMLQSRESNEAIDRLVLLLGQIPPTAAEQAKLSQNSDAELLFSLQKLMVALDAARWTADLLDGHEHHTDSFELINVDPNAHPNATATSRSASAMPLQQSSRTQQVSDSRRQSGSIHHQANQPASSPSLRREELRDPFADSARVWMAPRLPNDAAEDRRREVDERSSQSDASWRLTKMLDDLYVRSVSVLETIDVMPDLFSDPDSSEATLDASVEGKQQMQSTWLDLQAICKSTHESLLKRHSLPFHQETRRDSSSPSNHCYTYSPSRARSRRDSIASLTASLNSMEAGDPIGEATAAGLGLGASRSLSVSSQKGSSNGQGGPTYSSLDVHRRGSTKSESHSAHSLPPRYSEEAISHWAGRRDYDSGTVENGLENREDISSSFSMRTLPAYDTQDAAYQHLLKKGENSTASLIGHDDKVHGNQSQAMAKEAEAIGRGRSANSRGQGSSQLYTSTSDGAEAVGQGRPFLSNDASHFAHGTPQDLRMLENSIERLYSAVPQLNDQRALSTRIAGKRDDDIMLGLIEKMTGDNRMQDQRVASPPSSSSRRGVSFSGSPGVHEGSSPSPVTPTSVQSSNGRLARRLGSISFGSLALRRAASLMSSEGKGKEKEKDRPSPGNEVMLGRQPTLDELSPLADSLQAASERSYEDQRAHLRSSGKAGTKPSRLDLMDLNHHKEQAAQSFKDEDDLFDVLLSSTSDRRMANQDAVPSSGFNRKSLPATVPDSVSSGLTTSLATDRAASECLAHHGTNAIKQDGETDARVGLASRGDRVRATGGPPHLMYIAESQPRLGSVPVAVWTEGNAPEGSQLRYSVDEGDNRLLHLHGFDSAFAFTLPCEVTPPRDSHFLTATWRIDRWHFTLKMLNSGAIGEDRTQYAMAPLSAPVLQRDLPKALACSGCTKAVADTDQIVQYIPLPSQHWEELVESWMCHADQELNQDVIDSQKRLAGHHDLHIAQARVSEDLIVIDPSLLRQENTYKEQIQVRCSGCHSYLGEQATSGAIKLNKYAIHLKRSLATSQGSLVGQVIANTLIRLAQAHATRHFTIRDQRVRNKGYLKLWLFLESFDVALSLPSSIVDLRQSAGERQDSISLPACKVMYQIVDAGEEVAAKPEQAWAQPDSVEHLSYPEEVCLRVRMLLQQSTLCFPPSCRTFGAHWTIGFLETCNDRMTVS